MITVRTNISHVIGSLKAKFQALKSTEELTRTLATNTRASMMQRIHVEGLASDGQPIGTYSAGYMKVRTGNFKNAGKRNSGTFTDRTIRLNKQNGVFTGEDKVGKKRPNYNRTNDTKVVISLTRQMENDFVTTPTPSGGYGVGYNNLENYKKVAFVESTYNKPIFKLTDAEKQQAKETAIVYFNKAITNP